MVVKITSNILNSLNENCSNYKINCTIYKNALYSINKIKNCINNFIIKNLEERVNNINISEDEYLKHIYDMYNKNLVDIERWQQMGNDIKLKNKEEITNDDKSTLLILNKSIKLTKTTNDSLLQAYLEMSRGKEFTKEIVSKNKSYVENEKSKEHGDNEYRVVIF